MFQRLQVQFTVLFTTFVLLVMTSVGATYWGLQTQQQDALVINLAGRQRMLIQQMTRLALQSQNGDEAALAVLKDSERMFSQTLSALRDGGSALYLADRVVNLPSTQDAQLLAALDEQQTSWDAFRTTLGDITSSSPENFASLQAILEEQSDDLVQKADVVVRLYETNSTAKVNRLRVIQVTFLVCALALLAVGAWLTRRSLLKPLQGLSLAAKRLGENDLETQVQVEGPEEIRALSHAFDNMRSRLRAARGELIQWNATLEQRVAQRTQELETLNEVSREISSRLNLQQVLNSVTDKARTLLGGEVASLCLVDENQRWLKLQALSGPRYAIVGEIMPVNDEFSSKVLSENHALICGMDNCQGGCRMLSTEYRASHLAAPLRVGDHVIGALCVGSLSQNQFAEESTDMLIKLANVAAIALENARLFAQAERVATLEERRRVAAEMHDGLGQTLSYLGLMTDQTMEFLSDGQDEVALERLQKTRETIERAAGDVRRAINNLMDESSSSEIDLNVRLQNAVSEFAKENGLGFSWSAEVSPRCSRQVAGQVLNVAREALKNIARHADAKHVAVRMGESDGHYFVAIEDDGKGFDAAQPEPNGHFGLKIMQARAMHIGGYVDIESEQGCGTCVTLTWAMENGE